MNPQSRRSGAAAGRRELGGSTAAGATAAAWAADWTRVPGASPCGLCVPYPKTSRSDISRYQRPAKWNAATHFRHHPGRKSRGRATLGTEAERGMWETGWKRSGRRYLRLPEVTAAAELEEAHDGSVIHHDEREGDPGERSHVGLPEVNSPCRSKPGGSEPSVRSSIEPCADSRQAIERELSGKGQKKEPARGREPCACNQSADERPGHDQPADLV